MKKSIETTTFLVKRFFPVLLVLLSFSACKKEKTEDAPIYNRDFKQSIIDSRKDLGNYLLTSSTPGISISVSVNGEIIYSEGLGLASKELNVPVKRNTKFRIGNTSQMFTSYLILKMQEQGLLDIDSSFYQYIPNFPKKQFDFTLRQLAAQTAGFPESVNEDFKNDKELRTLKDYVKKFENDSLVYKPDTYSLKSDYSFALLGILSENITKENYIKLIRDMVMDTLRLSNTVPDNPFLIITDRSEFYHRDYIARLMNAPETNLLPGVPAIGFLSTADNLNTAARAVLEPGFFSGKSIEMMVNPHKLESGQELNRSFGWIAATDHEGRKLIAQIGSTIGGSSAVVVYPEQKLVVSICANLGDDMQELPVLNIAARFLELPDKKENVTTDPTADRENPEADGPAE